MMVSMNVFCGATWPRRMGILTGQRSSIPYSEPQRSEGRSKQRVLSHYYNGYLLYRLIGADNQRAS
jgi:hypothetical protein